MNNHQPVILVFVVVIIMNCAELRAQKTERAITDEISYTNDIRPIVNNFCTTCHAGDDPQGDFVLTSYEAVLKHTKKGDLLERINDPDDPMPQNGLMPNYMRRLFKIWAEQGYINEGKAKPAGEKKQMQNFTPAKISVVDINEQGFEMLKYLQGHWVGEMNLMGQKFDWMGFDFRPIAPSHIHGLFEGGTIGNLFTSFFVVDFKGKRTIMARNGGILNGIYRTSYFVLDEVKYGEDWGYYRLVDAYGGKDVMYMELTFRGNSFEFNAYTSRFGLTEPKPHMTFKGERMHPELATNAAKAVGFPKNVVDYEFPNVLPKPTWADEYPLTSSSYIWEDTSKELIELGKLAKDPRRIDQMPYLAQMTVAIERNELIKDKKLLVYLSRDALVHENGKFIQQHGYIREDLLNTLLLFPELAKNQSEFTFTYLHPGDYYLTVIADMDEDGFPSAGDITHARRKVTVKPKSKQKVTIENMNVRN